MISPIPYNNMVVFFDSFIYFSITGGCDELIEGQVHVFAIPKLLAEDMDPPRVLISTSSTGSVCTSLTIPGIGFEEHTQITRLQNADISLPFAARITTAGLHNKTIIVRSSIDVNVYAFDNERYNGDGFLVIPISKLGIEYRIPNYVPSHSSHPSFFTVTALEQEASVFFATMAGQEYNVTLNMFESYRFEGTYPEDLTGTYIKSNMPISVTSGVYTKVPKGISGSDGILVNVPPVESWGHRFVLAPILTKSCGYIYRVISGNESTIVTTSENSAEQVLPPRGMIQGNVGTSKMVAIHADHPVLVAKYLKGRVACDSRGDPAMIVVTPVESYQNNIVTFPVLATTYPGVKFFSINVITNCSDTGTLSFDGTISINNWDKLSLEDGSMCCVRGEIAPGVHSVESTDSSVRFTVSVYMISVSCSQGCSAPTAYAYQAGSGYPGEDFFFFISL